MNYYIGLLSGTSVDGIDAAIIAINEYKIELINTHEQPFSSQLKKDLQAIIQSQSVELEKFSGIDAILAYEFSSAVNALLKKSGINKQNIIAIGSHGQTIYHQPDGKYKNTMQIGSPHIISANTGIDVVSNFRNMDMAFSGQGAPLAPLIHRKLFANLNSNTAVINLGGIANISFIGKDYKQPKGYDVGPANCLLDEWISIHKKLDFDKHGAWAQQGNLNQELLNQMLKDEYFTKPTPKSTGREYFNYQWYNQFGEQFKIIPKNDIQTTLTHLTAATIANAIDLEANKITNIILVGGGAKNGFMHKLIQQYSKINTVTSTHYDVDENWIEAILFAYLAYLRINKIKLDLSSFTGSKDKILVGDIIRQQVTS